MKKCGNAKNYQGLDRPKCNMGKGCDACNGIFQRACRHPAEKLVREEGYHHVRCDRCQLKFYVTSDNLDHFLFTKLLELTSTVAELKQQVFNLQNELDYLQEEPDPRSMI